MTHGQSRTSGRARPLQRRVSIVQRHSRRLRSTASRLSRPITARVRRRCRGRASDPGRDHAVARRRGVLRADRGRCGMAAFEEGNRLAEWPARRRARQRCRHGICAPQAIPRMGATHDRRAASISARCRITAAWFAACAPFGRNAWSRPWRPGSGRDRGWNAISGGSTPSLCNPIARANSTAGTNGLSAKAGT